MPSSHTDCINQSLMNYVIASMEPISTVENPALRQFVKTLEPRYQLMCRKSLKDKLQNKHTAMIRFMCHFTSCSTGRVILRRVVLQVEETSAYCTVNHRASASNYQLSNMKRPARDSNRRSWRLDARTLTATPPSPLHTERKKV